VRFFRRPSAQSRGRVPGCASLRRSAQAPTERPGCAGSVREARLRLVHTDSAVLAARGPAPNSRPGLRPGRSRSLRLGAPSHGRHLAARAAYARCSNKRRLPVAQGDGHPPAAALLAAAEARSRAPAHGFAGSTVVPAKPRSGGGQSDFSAPRSGAVRRLRHPPERMASSAVCLRSEHRQLAQRDAGHARRPPSRRLRGPARRRRDACSALACGQRAPQGPCGRGKASPHGPAWPQAKPLGRRAAPTAEAGAADRRPAAALRARSVGLTFEGLPA
jgi:hypothetical protein